MSSRVFVVFLFLKKKHLKRANNKHTFFIGEQEFVEAFLIALIYCVSLSLFFIFLFLPSLFTLCFLVLFPHFHVRFGEVLVGVLF